MTRKQCSPHLMRFRLFGYIQGKCEAFLNKRQEVALRQSGSRIPTFASSYAASSTRFRETRKVIFLLAFFLLSSCSKPPKYCYKLKPAENIVALQEYKTTYHMSWPFSVADKDKLTQHASAKWLHLDLFAQANSKNRKEIETWLEKHLPNMRHFNWYDDAYQKAGTIRIVVSDYKPLLPLGPNWYEPKENQPLWDHGRTKATNLGVMIDDPYELKTTDPIGPIPASSLHEAPKEPLKIDVESS